MQKFKVSGRSPMFPEQSKAQSRNHDKALAPTKALTGSHSLKQPRTADYDFSSEVIFKNLLINKKIFALLALQQTHLCNSRHSDMASSKPTSVKATRHRHQRENTHLYLCCT